MNTEEDFQCVVCNEIRTGGAHWYLLTENPRLDRLQVLLWNETDARRHEMFSVCGPSHAGELASHWMASGTLIYPYTLAPTAWHEMSHTSPKLTPESKQQPALSGKVIGELSVHRESMDRLLSQNPFALVEVLDALRQALDESVHGAGTSYRKEEPVDEVLLLV